MKKRLKKGEVRVIKIDEEALYEFIRETIQEKCLTFFDLLDYKHTETCMWWNKANNSFTCMVYNDQDRAMIDFDAIDDSLDFTTSTLYKKQRYITLDVHTEDGSAY